MSAKLKTNDERKCTMKITDKRHSPVAFKELSIGEVFKTVTSPSYYIKTSSVSDNYGDVISNSTNLNNGLAHYFDSGISVLAVEAELIIT